jgi:hypothetical protein
MRPDKDRGRPLDKGGLEMEQVTGTATTQSIPDWRDRRAALARLQAQEDHRRVCTWLHRLAPLTVYYGPRRWAA